MKKHGLGEMKLSFLRGIDCINEIAQLGQLPDSLVE